MCWHSLRAQVSERRAQGIRATSKFSSFPLFTTFALLASLIRTNEAALGAAARLAVPRRPNILLIIADDLRPDLLGSYKNKYYQPYDVTPHLDRLAKEGLRFDQAFTTAPLCAPARFSLNTGHYNSRRATLSKRRKVPDLLSSVLHSEEQFYYVTNNGMFTDAEVTYYQNRTMGHLLREVGYNTAGIGKWHMGADLHEEAFNYSYLLATNSQDHSGWNVAAGAPGHNPEELTYQALRWLEKQRYSTTPWFLYLSYTVPHSPYDMRSLLAEDPLTGQEPFLGTAERDERGLRRLQVEPYRLKEIVRERHILFHDLKQLGLLDAPAETLKFEASLGALRWLDLQVGKVLQKLQGMRVQHHTMVVFTADHGIVQPLGVGKGSLNNEGLRVPMIARWNGRIPRDTVANVPVSLLDLLPTFLEVAGGVHVADNLDLHGNSLVPVLHNAWPHAVLDNRALFAEVGIARAVMQGGYKFIYMGPTRATSDGDVCAEAYGDYMSEKKTGRLEKTFFCHHAVCAAEQIYRYTSGCEQLSVIEGADEAASDMLNMVLDHIRTHEGGEDTFVLSDLVPAGNQFYAEMDLGRASRIEQDKRKTTSQVSYSDVASRLGCNDKHKGPNFFPAKDKNVDDDPNLTPEMVCDYRWHTYFSDAKKIVGSFLKHNNGSAVPIMFNKRQISSSLEESEEWGAEGLLDDNETDLMTQEEAAAADLVDDSPVDASVENILVAEESLRPRRRTRAMTRSGPLEENVPPRHRRVVPDFALRRKESPVGLAEGTPRVIPYTALGEHEDGPLYFKSLPDVPEPGGESPQAPRVPMKHSPTAQSFFAISESQDGSVQDVLSPGARLAMEAHRELEYAGAEELVQEAMEEVAERVRIARAQFAQDAEVPDPT